MQVKLTLHIQSEPINNSLKVAVSSRQMRIISAIKRNPFMNREELAKRRICQLLPLGVRLVFFVKKAI